VFEKRVLRTTFGPKSEDVTGICAKLNNEGLHVQYAYFSPNVIRAVKSRRMRRKGHVERMGEIRTANKILIRESEETTPLGISRGAEWSIILKRILRKCEDVDWSMWLKIRSLTDSCEQK
jgi:hypothetical protein